MSAVFASIREPIQRSSQNDLAHLCLAAPTGKGSSCGNRGPGDQGRTKNEEMGR